MVRNWDTQTDDKCELPKLIKGICERCRDYAYCHRPIKLFEEVMQNDKRRTDN